MMAKIIAEAVARAWSRPPPPARPPLLNQQKRMNMEGRLHLGPFPPRAYDGYVTIDVTHPMMVSVPVGQPEPDIWINSKIVSNPAALETAAATIAAAMAPPPPQQHHPMSSQSSRYARPQRSRSRSRSRSRTRSRSRSPPPTTKKYKAAMTRFYPPGFKRIPFDRRDRFYHSRKEHEQYEAYRLHTMNNYYLYDSDDARRKLEVFQQGERKYMKEHRRPWVTEAWLDEYFPPIPPFHSPF